MLTVALSWPKGVFGPFFKMAASGNRIICDNIQIGHRS